MESRNVAFGVGLFVLIGVLALLMLALEVSNLSVLTDREGYRIRARFDNIGGLKVRAPVTMAGVRVGRVAAIEFDSQTYEAVVEMSIDARYDRIPADSTASIYTAGLLGEQYIALEPGAEEEYLEQLIGQFLFQKASEGPASGGGGDRG